MSAYCVIGCTRGTGLLIVEQLTARGAQVLAVARNPLKARGRLPTGPDLRYGDVTEPSSLEHLDLGKCRAIFFAVDVTGGVTGRGFFAPNERVRAVTYQGLVNTVDAAKSAGFAGRFVLLSGMGSELPSLTGMFLNTVKGNLQANQRDRDAYLQTSGLDWSIGRGGVLTDRACNGTGIRITPPVHSLSIFRRVTRTDFARVLIALAEVPSASGRKFDVFNVPGPSTSDDALAAQLQGQ